MTNAQASLLHRLAWALFLTRGLLFIVGLLPRDAVRGDDLAVIFAKEALRLAIWVWSGALLFRISSWSRRSRDMIRTTSAGVGFWIALAAIESVLIAGAALEWIYFSEVGRAYRDMPDTTQALDWLFSMGMLAAVVTMVVLERRWATRPS